MSNWVPGRNLSGYGPRPPIIEWPNGARIAINLALNYEEGTERNPLLGDDRTDSRKWFNCPLPPGGRDLMQEAEFDYGSRVGIWRMLRLFSEYKAPFSVFVSSEALKVHPEVTAALRTEDCDFIAHGTRSISRVGISEAEERAGLRQCIDDVYAVTGRRIRGAFPRPPLTLNSRRIMAEEGLLYDSASTDDDLPHYEDVDGRPMLVVPYALDTNDMGFWGSVSGPGFGTATDFFDYLRDAFDVLYREAGSVPRMMSIGLHSRIMRPGRAAGLTRFLDHVTGFRGVWLAKRDDIALVFAAQYAPPNAWNTPEGFGYGN